MASYVVWLSATRTAKLLPHLWYRPQDIIFVPAFILFGYYFAIMKLYALFTLHETGWGTRAGVGDAAAATAAAEAEAKEKEKVSNYPYNHSQPGRSASMDLPPTPGYQTPLSPFRDTPPSPFGGNGGRRRGDDELVEMQDGVGYAR